VADATLLKLEGERQPAKSEAEGVLRADIVVAGTTADNMAVIVVLANIIFAGQQAKQG
jgi:hypothetical protein